VWKLPLRRRALFGAFVDTGAVFVWNAYEVAGPPVAGIVDGFSALLLASAIFLFR